MTFEQKQKRLVSLYLETLKKHDLPHLPFKFSKTKKSLGRFIYYKSGNPCNIEVSIHYIKICPIEILEDTVLHEIAHYMDFLERGRSNHDHNWKRCCVIVGANPERTCDLPKEYQPKGRYAFVCENHGIIGYRHKMTKKLKYGRYRCSKCQCQLKVMDVEKNITI